MIIEEVARKDVPAIKYGRNKLMQLVLNFHRSEQVAIKISTRPEEYSTVKCCADCIRSALRRCELNNGIKVMVRGNYVYLIKTEEVNNVIY